MAHSRIGATTRDRYLAWIWVDPVSAPPITESADFIVIVSGPPGVGKSTVARMLAEQSSAQRALHMHTDDFFRYIRKGYIAPWLPVSHTQNVVVLEAFAASALRFAHGGYHVYVDGVVGPWFLAPWMAAVNDGFDVRLMVLRPSRLATIARATSRNGVMDLVDSEVVGTMWQYFADLGEFEPHAFDTTEQKPADTVFELQKRLAAGEFRLRTQLLARTIHE